MADSTKTTTESDGTNGISSHHEDSDQPLAPASFHDLDEANNIEWAMHIVQSNSTLNFTLDFSDDEACVAFDLPVPSIGKLLDADHLDGLNTRWINIWHPYQQRPVIELIARKYDFSPRLLAMICSDPSMPRRPPTLSAPHITRKAFWSRRPRPSSGTDSSVEKGSDELSEHSSISSYDSLLRGNLYKIVDDLWHYSSVDYGRNYVCVGYNSLYGTKQTDSQHTEGDGLLPHCTRVWTWLVLCDDNTVITINEDPFATQIAGRLDSLQQRILQETRRNLVNVFRSLSRVDEVALMVHSPMALLPMRIRLGDTPEETAHRESDAPGLLFYYLFENWQNSYTLVTRRESRYGVELRELRGHMFTSPKLSHIDRLDSIGRELGVLKRHYQSYIRIVENLLEIQYATSASLNNSHIVSDASQASLDTVRPLATEKESLLGVSLSSAARVRFRRLKDMIELYALSEVEEYIKQKDSLVNMNFSLVATKQSLDMERLTRVTLLITKATILFLPVSLMTSYFSVGLKDVSYTIAEFWISFAVILLLSLSALFVFGVFSGSVQTAVFFQGLWRSVRSGWRAILGTLR